MTDVNLYFKKEGHGGKKYDAHHKKHKGIPLEFMETNKKYAFTFNPAAQPLSKMRASLDVWYRQMYEIFIKYNDTIIVNLYIEASPTGRLHFHGSIEVLHLIKYTEFLREINSICSYEIDTIEDESVWDKYITKQSSIWEHHFKKNVIGYPLKNSGSFLKDSRGESSAAN